MDQRTSEHPEPSHIHVPRPSNAARRPVLLESACPGDICVQFVDRGDERTLADSD